MKIKRNDKYTTIAMYACVTAAAIILVSCFLLNFTEIRLAIGKFIDIISPILIGFIIAYLLNPLFKLFENKVFSFVDKKKPRRKFKRAIALIFTYLTLFVAIGTFFTFIVPQIVKSYTQLQAKASGYISSVIELLGKYAGESGVLRDLYDKVASYADSEKLKSLLGGFFTDSIDLILNGTTMIFGYAISVVNAIKNLVIGVILSVYFLASKEFLIGKVKKWTYAIVKEKVAGKIRRFITKADRIFGGYIVGTILDSLLLGVILFLLLMVLRIPYYPLIAVICGITNMIPFFGPFIGAIPSVFIVLVENPIKAIWLVLIILLVQQIDGNIIAPKIIGDHTGLKPFWIIVAITVMGGLFGIIGMFIGVPVFAVIYTLVKDMVEIRLEKKGLPVNTEDYMYAAAEAPAAKDSKEANVQDLKDAKQKVSNEASASTKDPCAEKKNEEEKV